MTTATKETVGYTAKTVQSRLKDRVIRPVGLQLNGIKPFFEEDPYIEFEEEELDLTPGAYRNFMRFLDVPTKYFNRVSSELKQEILNYHMAEQEDKTLYALVSGKRIIGFGNERKPILSSLKAFDAVNELIDNTVGGDLTVRDIDVDINGVVVAWTTDALTVTPREGDITEGGILLKLPEDGSADPSVGAYANRLVCANGMIRQVDGQKFHLLGRTEEDVLEELESAASLILGSLQETILSPFAGTDAEPVDDPMGRALGIARYHRLSKKQQQAYTMTVQAELSKDSTQQRKVTMYDMINWLTQIGSPKHNSNADWNLREQFATLGGREIGFHSMRCNACHSVVG